MFPWSKELYDCKLKIRYLEDKLRVDPLETFWNNKRDKAFISYTGREIPKWGMCKCDVRNFWTVDDFNIPIFNGKSNDDTAFQCLLWVKNNVTYKSDEDNVGLPEYWQYAYETLKLGIGDCDDGGILLANMLVKSGIPYWRVRLNAGEVVGGGHLWVTYLRESDNKWVVLDWCYWFDYTIVKERYEYKDLKNYKNIWFSWNRDYCFKDEDFSIPSNNFREV